MLSRNYQIIDTLHENMSTVVYRARRTKDGKTIILKMLKPGEITEHRVSQFMNEQQMLSSLKSPYIVKLIDIVALPSEYFHVFEDIGGKSLYEMLHERRFSIGEGLNIAIKITEALQIVHQKRIIHADVNPKNIIYNDLTKELQLIDFGYSIIDNHFRYNSDTDIGTSGNLMYMSPEQTGRTKQRIDTRSDLYSLGMSLYHLFSGRLPFEAKDRYELIHKQIALRPEPIENEREAFPPVLSSIINRLTAKKPDERYQSDEALLYDLKYALQTLDSSDRIPLFEIGTRDQPSLRFGDQLFGRETEIGKLRDALNAVAAHQSVRMVVSGASGVGKTRFIEEFLSMLNAAGCRVLRGKFEQYRSAHPYLSIKQLFLQLKMIWKRHINAQKPLKLDSRSAYVLGYYFPELREMLKIKHLSYASVGEEIHQQLPYAFGQLLGQLSADASALVIFMDDLQWADAASLDLIYRTVFQNDIPDLHFIFSYRDREIESNPAAWSFVQKVRTDRSESLYLFDLIALAKSDIRSMVRELLNAPEGQTDALADIIHKKTDGNPFYIKTFLNNLIDSKELTYDKGRWRFALDTIRTYGASLNIAGLVTEKFSRLSAEEQHYLRYLAILGSRFESGLALQLMKEQNFPPLMMQQTEAKGFIELFGEYYQFVHDMIQHHIITSISTSERIVIERTIGEFLERSYRSGRYADVISVVMHLNRGSKQGGWDSRSLGLNLKALKEMVLSGSYPIALEHLRWMEESGLCQMIGELKRADAFDYKVLRIKVFYLNALHDEAHSALQTLISQTEGIRERLVCFTLFKNLCVTRGNGFRELIDFGNRLLRDLGQEVPDDRDSIEQSVSELSAFILNHPASRDAEAIKRLPELKSVAKQRIVSILVEYWEAAYYQADIGLMQWAYLSIVESSLRFGSSSESAFGYVLYGAQMVSEYRYKEAYRFGEAALKLNHRFGDEVMLPKVHNFMANFISPYTKPFERNLPLYRKSLHQSKINGDIVFGTWANFLMHLSDYFSGKSLEALRVNIAQESQFLLNSGDQKMIAIFEVLRSTLRTWQERTDDTPEAEQEAVALWEEEKFYPALAWYGIIKAQSCWIEGEIDEGLEYLHRYVRSEANEVIMFPKLRLHPLRALLLLSKSTPLNAQERLLLEGDLKLCDAYAASSPKEFRFWKLLLHARSDRNVRSHWESAKRYDEALNEARKNANPFAIAVSALCAGRFWKGKGFDDLSRFYFSEAAVGLNQWGAYRAAERLKAHLPLNPPQPLDGVEHSSNSSLLRAEPTNYRSLLKSFYALSQSMDKKELLQTLMQTIVENATASKAVLILKEEENFYVSARYLFETKTIELLHTPLSEVDCVPFHLITHAIDTHHKVVQNSPSESGKFQYDDYFQRVKPASSIAIPTLVEGSVRGVLYLENDEVFTPLDTDTLQTLRLLLTQAVIVYKNALLYATLKSNEEKLNKAQQISHVGSWEYDSVTNKILWSAETYRIYEMEPFSIPIDNEWFYAHLHPDDIPLIQEATEKAFSAERYYDVTHRILTDKGNIRYVHQRAEVYWENECQKFAGTIQDITDLKRSQEMIDRLSQVVNQTPLSTIITDRDGVIEYVNNQTLKLTGYFSHELIGQKMNLFNSGRHPESFFQELWTTIAVKRSFWRGTLVNRIKNGDVRDFASTIFPILSPQGEITNFVTIQDDVTERNLKDRLFLMQTRQAQMGEMLSMIAHQWRQPLAIMSALMSRQKINIMLERSTLDEITKSFDEMELQVQHLSRTITDFKDFFKPDKQTAMTKSSLIVSKTLDLVEHTLMNKNIRVTVEHLNDVEYRTYENELIQVMLNLIKNAQDAYDEKKIPHPLIVIRSDVREGSVTISVEDNAGGIDPAFMESIFSPYTSTKSDNGTGLGLYMSKIILEEHCHGSIRAENTEDGARFILSFPMQMN